MEMTTGFEWEMLLLKEDGGFPKKEEIESFGRKIRFAVPGSRCGIDFLRGGGWMFEARSGIVRGREEIKKRVNEIYERAFSLAEEKKYILLPLGIHPLNGGACGLHVHTGTFRRFETALETANRVFPYTPVFAALAANSPFYLGMRDFLSCRVLRHADLCSVPPPFEIPELSRWNWGGDSMPKVGMKPTLEIRVCDAPSFPDVASEIILFIRETLTLEHPPLTRERYIETIFNKMRVGMDGLRAVIEWNGKKREVSEIVFELLERMKNSFPLIRLMAEKRITQADMWRELPGDGFSLVFDIAEAVKNRNLFKDYLSSTPSLSPVLFRERDDVLKALINPGDSILLVHTKTFLPFPMIESFIRKHFKTEFNEEGEEIVL